MSGLWRVGLRGVGRLLGAAALGGAALAAGTALAQPPQLQSEAQGDNRRESQLLTVAPGSRAPELSFIDSPTVACYQPNPVADVCWINWYYMWVDATPASIVSMEVTIDPFGKVARYHGFFQQSMYVPYNLHDRGFRVSCGSPGAGGNPDWGKAYSWSIRATDSGGLTSTNWGTAYCPPYVP